MFLVLLTITSSVSLAADYPALADSIYCQTFPVDESAALCYLQPDNTYAQWFLVHKGAILKVDIDNTEAQMSRFSFSPSGRFMVVESRGEGHPLLQVYATGQLLERIQVKYLQGWNGYPGWVSFVRWEGDALMIESNVPLHQDYDTSADYPEDVSALFRWSADRHELEFVKKKPLDPNSLRTGPFLVIYFTYDQFTINPDEEDKLINLSLLFRDSPEMKLQIEGHTDERGSADYILTLGERQARSVKAFLVDMGVDPGRMTIMSYGESRPVALESDQAAWDRNRLGITKNVY